MAQGLLKRKSKSSQPSSSSKVQKTKKGQRSIAPRKRSLQQQHKLNKQFAAKLSAQTERSLAEKAGHLEILKGGKREKGQKTDGKKKKNTGKI